ncbi:MAG: ferrochelatase [candidate division Zixibacteria bacterium]
MSESDQRKFCVILLAMGGPDKPDDVKEFLFNIFSDRSIIRLPGGKLFQKPFARMIASRRSGKVRARYELIGGGSPLLAWTESQAEQIEQVLAADFGSIKCYVGMRYWKPSIDEAITEAEQDGYKTICFLPMYPQYSRATTGSSFQLADQLMAAKPGMKAVFIGDFSSDSVYTSLLHDWIEANIRPDDTLLFSAHAVPQKFIDDGDPYVDQVIRSASIAAGDREHFVSFQSRTGPVKWVRPDTIDEARRLLTEREGSLFIVPISFVCDHIETLYEIDIQLKEILGEELGSRIRRMPMFNNDQRFAAVLARIVRERMNNRGKI